MSYKECKIDLWQYTDSIKNNKITKPFNVSIKRDKIATFSSIGYGLHDRVIVRIFPELVLNKCQESLLDNAMKPYLDADKVLFSVDSLDELYFEFFKRMKTSFRRFQILYINWNRNKPTMKRISSVTDTIFAVNILSKIPNMSFQVKVDKLLLTLQKNKIVVGGYLSTLSAAYRIEGRAKVMCGVSMLTQYSTAYTVAMYISLLYDLPTWQKRLLLMKHKKLKLSLNLHRDKGLPKNTNRTQQGMGKIITTSFLLNDGFYLSPISYPMFSLKAIQLIIGRVQESLNFKCSFTGMGGKAKHLRNLVEAAEMLGHKHVV